MRSIRVVADPLRHCWISGCRVRKAATEHQELTTTQDVVYLFDTKDQPPHASLISAQIIALLLLASQPQRADAQPGQIERGFAVPGMRTSRTLGVQPDGKVLLVGVFTNSPSGALLVRLAADGSIEWKSAPLSGAPQTIAAGWNGEIFGGSDNSAYRFLPPATEIDASFTPGLGWRSSDPWAVAFQPNGGILIAGSGPTGSQVDWGSDRALRNTPVRVTPSGSRDLDFFGKIGVGTSTDIAVLPDGSFLVARSDVRRFLADGTPDSSFSPWNVANVELLRRLPSGDFLVGGGAMRTFNGTSVKTLIRVSASGVLDTTFKFCRSLRRDLRRCRVSSPRRGARRRQTRRRPIHRRNSTLPGVGRS